jgi:uncharacterized LabA/DUF88 family protein
MAIAVLADTNNLSFCVRKGFPGFRLNYEKYLSKIQEITGDDVFTRCYAYGFQKEDEAKGFIIALKRYGFDSRFRQPPSNLNKANHSVAIALDAMCLAERVDTMVIGSTDPCLVPLLEKLKETGIQVIVFAAGIPSEMKERADGFYEINSDVLEESRD